MAIVRFADLKKTKLGGHPGRNIAKAKYFVECLEFQCGMKDKIGVKHLEFRERSKKTYDQGDHSKRVKDKKVHR